MQTVIIDTDIAIDYLRGLEQAKKLMQRLWEGNTAHISILSVYELYAGMRENEAKDTENFINACIIEPVTVEICEKAGEIYKRPRNQGTTLTSIDCLVNATAILGSHKVATKNDRHYPDKKILLAIH